MRARKARPPTASTAGAEPAAAYTPPVGAGSASVPPSFASAHVLVPSDRTIASLPSSSDTKNVTVPSGETAGAAGTEPPAALRTLSMTLPLGGGWLGSQDRSNTWPG